jgi:hypothetical protein
VQILFIGDIFGSAGRKIVREHIGHVCKANDVELVVINAENAAGGFGVTPQIADELFELGADVLTTGNHVWDKRELVDYIGSVPAESQERARRILRPANFLQGVPGYGVFEGVTRSGVPYAVVDLMGRVFMSGTNDPFQAVNEILRGIEAKVIVVDFHAEATSEKVAMGWYLDGRVTAVVGTHTHVTTADEHVLPKGTAYITDVGMSGPHDGVIGMERSGIIKKFLDGLPARFEVASGDIQMNAVLIETDENAPRNEAGRFPAKSIERLRLRTD